MPWPLVLCSEGEQIRHGIAQGGGGGEVQQHEDAGGGQLGALATDAANVGVAGSFCGKVCMG